MVFATKVTHLKEMKNRDSAGCLHHHGSEVAVLTSAGAVSSTQVGAGKSTARGERTLT